MITRSSARSCSYGTNGVLGDRRRAGAQIGLLVAWAMFNLIGVNNHHVLGIHHVREGVTNVGAWDLGFQGPSGLMLTVGLTLRSVTTTRQQPAALTSA